MQYKLEQTAVLITLLDFSFQNLPEANLA